MPTNDLDEFLKRVRQLRSEEIPSSKVIVLETFIRLGITRDKLTVEEVRERFNEFLQEAFRETLVTLEAYERPTYSSKAVRELTRIREEDVREVHAEMR